MGISPALDDYKPPTSLQPECLPLISHSSSPGQNPITLLTTCPNVSPTGASTPPGPEYPAEGQAPIYLLGHRCEAVAKPGSCGVYILVQETDNEQETPDRDRGCAGSPGV